MTTWLWPNHTPLMTTCPAWIHPHTLWIWRLGKHFPVKKKKKSKHANKTNSPANRWFQSFVILPPNLSWWFCHQCRWWPWHGWQWFQTTWTKPSAGCQTWHKSWDKTSTRLFSLSQTRFAAFSLHIKYTCSCQYHAWPRWAWSYTVGPQLYLRHNARLRYYVAMHVYSVY